MARTEGTVLSLFRVDVWLLGVSLLLAAAVVFVAACGRCDCTCDCHQAAGE